jgi:hypothetical protein
MGLCRLVTPLMMLVWQYIDLDSLTYQNSSKSSLMGES